MARVQHSRILVLPADTPIRRSTVKRLLLYFDSVHLPSPEDRAFINENEIVEHYPGGIAEIRWAARGHFPESPSYENVLEAIRNETRSLQSRGLLQFVPAFGHSSSDILNRLLSYHSAIYAR